MWANNKKEVKPMKKNLSSNSNTYINIYINKINVDIDSKTNSVKRVRKNKSFLKGLFDTLIKLIIPKFVDIILLLLKIFAN
jgi:hypothetical protein